ncbi:MAG: LacI family transcriptional regulator, partial [Puniceicoccaceae bacterium]
MQSETPPPTTRQIAKAAGVSHVTVSRVLRNHPFVNAETRQRVLDAAKSLGYRPNPLLGILMHQLRSRQTGDFVATLGWINSHQTEKEWHECPWRRELLEGAVGRAAQLGYKVNEFWTAEPGMNPKRLKKILLSRSIYGLILPPASDVKFLDEMDTSDLAIAVIGLPKVKAKLSFVDADTAAGMVEAVKGLRALGYRRPGLVIAPAQDPVGHPWRATFLAMQDDCDASERVPPLRLADTLKNCKPAYEAWLKTCR